MFIANGGGDDATIVENAETVPLEDAIEFQGVADGRQVTTDLCIVDTTRHGTNYEFDHCENDPSGTVLSSTADFIEDNWPA